MSAHVQSALRYRCTAPAWLVAVAIAAAFALTVVALTSGSEPIGQPSAAGTTSTQPSGAALSDQDTVRVDSHTVGHC